VGAVVNMVGVNVGLVVGAFVGIRVGRTVGSFVGLLVGGIVGAGDGLVVHDEVACHAVHYKQLLFLSVLLQTLAWLNMEAS
jgi:hypothetical protein